MLYAINVLKKIIMKEKSYILFWKVKKMWILKHVCLQSTKYVLFDEISLLLLPYIRHSSVFDLFCHCFIF